MCIDLWPLDGIDAGLTFGQLANVQTVGIGLYLALAVIQAVSTTGVAGLSRRVATLRNGVSSARLGAVELAKVRTLSGEVSGLEIGFYYLNRRLLRLIFLLFSISLGYFAYCTVWQNFDAGRDGVWFIFIFYLAVPLAIFLGSSILIARRCKAVATRVAEAEKRIRSALLGLS